MSTISMNNTKLSFTEPWWLSGLARYKSGALSNAQGPEFESRIFYADLKWWRSFGAQYVKEALS